MKQTISVLRRILQAFVPGKPVEMKLSQSEETVNLPYQTMAFLMELFSQMAQGKAMALIATDTELTTQQAADILQISRPHLVQLLEGGRIPFRKAGSHRRVLMADLLGYMSARQKRQKDLKFLAGQAQDLNLGYD